MESITNKITRIFDLHSQQIKREIMEALNGESPVVQATRIFELLPTAEKIPLTTHFTQITMDALTGLFQVPEEANRRVCAIIMHPKDYGIFRRDNRNNFDTETLAENLRKGIQGYVWGAMLLTSSQTEPGMVTLVAEDPGPDNTLHFYVGVAEKVTVKVYSR